MSIFIIVQFASIFKEGKERVLDGVKRVYILRENFGVIIMCVYGGALVEKLTGPLFFFKEMLFFQNDTKKILDCAEISEEILRKAIQVCEVGSC